MLNIKKTIILSVTTLILFIALISPTVLPDVTIGIKDAIVITVFVVVADLLMRFLGVHETKKLKKRILLQHSQMSTIINNLPFTISFRTPDGKILMVNKALANLLNYSQTDLIGRNSYEFYKNPQLIIDEDLQIVKDKKGLVSERIVEFIDKEPTWYRVVKAPVINSKGDVEQIIVINHNIENEREIQERKETFIATLTHDLKTPTISQIKALDLLLKGSFGELTNMQSDLVLQVKQSCMYMYDLIFTILDSYLYDNGQTKIVLEKFDLLELTNEIIAEISNLLNEKNLKINLTSSVSQNLVADRFQIKRVILNFLSNAINYGYSNSNIDISIVEKDSFVDLNITNKSQFIPEDRLKEMFIKFKSTTNVKFRKTSTGLGLYLSKQIIDAHQGKIYALSSEDDTCTFGFSIPKKLKNAKVILSSSENFNN